MLKRFDIIAYRTPELDKLSLGVVKKQSKLQETTTEISELSNNSAPGSSEWTAKEESKEIQKSNILLKVTKAKIYGKRSNFKNFRVEMNGFDIQKILMLNEIKKNKEEEQGTNLKKRRKRRGAKLQIEDCYEVFEFNQDGDIVERRRDTKQWKLQKKMLPSFMRTATTNLRFDLPDIEGDLKATPEPLNFSSRNFKTDRQTVLKTLSQDLSLVFNEEEQKRLKFIDVCQTVLKELEGKYGDKLKNPLNLTMANKEFVNVPSKKEMNQTLMYFAEVIDYLTENIKGSTEGLFYLILSNIFFFSLRFFMSHENSKLHLLKNKMFMDNFEEGDVTGIERLMALYSTLLKFVRKIKGLLTDDFAAEYLDLHQKNCSLIGDLNEQVINEDENLDENLKKKMKKFFAVKVLKVVEELMLTERSESTIIQIFKSLVKNLNFSNIQFALKGKQTIIGKKLNQFYNIKMNHTNKRWNLFVDSCCQYIRENRMEDIKKIQEDQQMIESLTHKMLSIQTSVAKALYLSALRVVLDEQVKKTTEGSGFGETMNVFLDSLLESGEKLPIFIYFVQSMSRYHGDIEDFAKNKGIKPLESFVQKFMFESGSEQAENLKYCPSDYQKYIETRNRMFFVLSNKKEEDVLSFLQEGLLKVKLDDKEKANYFNKKEENRNKMSVVWNLILNEIFTSYISEEPFEQRELLVKIFDNAQEQLLESYSKSQVRLMSLVLHNFNGDSILSISSKDKKDELSTKMMILHTIVTLILTNHKMLGKFPDEKDNQFVQRGQLSALPGKAEEKYMLIANTFYSLDSNWRSGQQFTKLYRCSCGYLYWIGDCGRAWVVGTCPSCKKKIGGTSHNLANKDNIEISKEHFFKEMYGPLEEISGRVYQVRSLEGKYSKKQGETGAMMEEKPAEEENGMEEIETPKEQETPVNKDYMPIRSLDKECHFLLVEFISHCRYLLDFLVADEDIKQGIKDFISLEDGKYEQYFFDVISNDYKKLKKIEFGSTNKEQYFKGMLIFFRENLLEKLDSDIETDRNKTENLVTKLFDLFKPQFSNKLIERIEMKKDLDGNLSNSSKLVKNWVNRLASISEFKKKNSDIKVISAMRFDKEISIDKLKEYLNARLQVEESQETGNKETARKIKFLMKVIGLEPILVILKRMLFSHIDFCNYLQHLFDFRLTYQMACSISIHDLITQDPIVDDSEMGKEFQEERRLIIQRNRNDISISSKFNSLKEAWDSIMKYREEFGDLFDFRFLCHATEMPQEKIDEIFDLKTAKLIYFLPNEKYVESLFMTSSLQTIGNIQNNLIKENKKEFFRANYSHPVKICTQDAGRRDIVGMSTSFKDFIKKSSFSNLSFNKDQELVYNVDMMDREIAIDLFYGKKLLSFEGDFIKNFNFSREFSKVANYISLVSNRFGQTYIEDAKLVYINNACDFDIQETFSVFGRKLKELAEKNFNLALINKISDEKDEFVINFECQQYVSDGDNVTADEKETTIVDHLNQARITLNNVRFVYEIIESRMFSLGVGSLDGHLDVKISDEMKATLKTQIGLLGPKQAALVLRVAKAMILRQLVGTTNENIGPSQLKMYLEYSDALHEDEDIEAAFLTGLPDDLQMHHLKDFVSLF